MHAATPRQYNVAKQTGPGNHCVAVLEKLRPLTSQLHHKIDLPPDDPLLEMVLIGYAPNNYGPEVGPLNTACSRSRYPRGASIGKRASCALALRNYIRRKTCATHDC